MITFISGNIFESPAQVITNTINCVGVMGKGLALEYKKKFPQMFEDYKLKCRNGQVKPGEPYIWENEEIQILNFPTKRHWRAKSRLEDISSGLDFIVNNYEKWGIYTLAIPALGCANGGLNWKDVRNLMIKHLADIPDLEVFAYEPRAVSRSFLPHDDKDKQIQKLKPKRSIAASPRSLF